MKIDWTTGLSKVLGRKYWQYAYCDKEFVITEIKNKVYWLHLNNNYIGSFTTFNKAQKVAELILKG